MSNPTSVSTAPPQALGRASWSSASSIAQGYRYGVALLQIGLLIDAPAPLKSKARLS